MLIKTNLTFACIYSVICIHGELRPKSGKTFQRQELILCNKRVAKGIQVLGEGKGVCVHTHPRPAGHCTPAQPSPSQPHPQRELFPYLAPSPRTSPHATPPITYRQTPRSGSAYFPELVVKEVAKATLIQGLWTCFLSLPSPCPWSLPVTNGHKHVSDIPGHLLLDGVLHVIVGHLDELLEDWPQEKPPRWEVSSDAGFGGNIILSPTTQQQLAWLQPRPKSTGQGYCGRNILTSRLP